jgi:hypothetical protein
MPLPAGELNKFYDCLSVYEALLLRVGHDSLLAYCRWLGRIQRKIGRGGGSDDRLHEKLSPYKRFMYDALSVPIPFSSEFYSYLPGKDYNERMRQELTISFPEVVDIYEDLLINLETLRASPDNPLLEAIISIARGQQFPLVVKSRRYVEFVRRASANAGLSADVILPSDLQPNKNTKIGFAIGFSIGRPEWFPESLRRVPIARKITLVEYEWIKKIANPTALFVKPLRYTPLPDLAGADAVRIEDLDEHEFISAGNADDVANLREYAIQELRLDSHFGAESERVPARLAFFENNWMAFLSADDGTRYNVVQVRDAKNVQIARKRLRELQADDPLVLRIGGGGDYVEEVANSLLAHNAHPFREMQKRWKRRLQEKIDQYDSLELAVGALRMAGCGIATPPNIRQWLAPRSIGLGARSDWSALCKFIGIGEEEEGVHWQSIRMLRKVHVRAGNQIRLELLEQLKKVGISQFYSSGTQVVQLPGHDDISLILLSLMQIDPEILSVPPARLEHPFERD